MTPDLTTPEGRAESDLARHERWLDEFQAKLDALDAETKRSAALAREIIALRSDLDDALVSVIKNQCRIDDLEATIERLTAPVTEEEGFDVVSLLGRGWSPDHVLDAFLARRKEPAP